MKFLELLIPPPVVTLITALLMWLLHVSFPSFSLHVIGQLLWVFIMGLLGLGFGLAGVASFIRAKTTLDPKQPADASKLVTSGIYRFTRNPMYLGILCMLIAWGLYLGNILSLLFSIAFVLYIHSYQIRPEERLLQEKFGADFISYKSKVRPWI